MLVLTRRPNESIVIANNIKITVVSVGPGRVKLGIEAPPNVRVDRQEIHDKIELSADVLATVGVSEHTADAHNTMIGAGPDTALIVSSNPTATPNAAPSDAPSAVPVTANAGSSSAPAVPPLPLSNKLSKYRLPRKPR
ncbi:carbon storage regulator [Frigoriglobus tundricola]|uniref:Translational regulator CsrA n=1 Tax=Frigoriglobus tundricola TaxID=2774151 RepID=A0A6M5YNP0_9BACT|nr:carbon storage regulator [Frigoriglobus tundricola]QJW94582.1 Carbon storage regulator [Frigoriglobus tundricola]